MSFGKPNKIYRNISVEELADKTNAGVNIKGDLFMKDIFDKNLSVEKAVFDDNMKFYRVPSAPFKLYGNCVSADNIFARMPEKIAENISDGVADRAARSAGVRLRFKTNSKRLGLKVNFKKALQFPAQSAVSTKGFDVYTNGEYLVSVIPQNNSDLSYEQLVELGSNSEKDIVMYFPYNAVIDVMQIGLDKNAVIKESEDYPISLPIVFYGSSITQGFCVSRPGNVFSAMVSRKLNADYINLGFSGVCRGELPMAEYLASLKKSVLVCGYDHNEQCAADLEKRHLSFYKKFREMDKETPILFVSSPNSICKGEIMYERMKIVEKTYKYALENGDNNVYFIDGQTLYPDEIRFDCSADAIHPNDLGSYMIAEKICKQLRKILFQMI